MDKIQQIASYKWILLVGLVTTYIAACKQSETASSDAHAVGKELTEEEKMRKEIMGYTEVSRKEKRHMVTEDLGYMTNQRLTSLACLKACPVKKLPFALTAESMLASLKNGNIIGQKGSMNFDQVEVEIGDTNVLTEKNDVDTTAQLAPVQADTAALRLLENQGEAMFLIHTPNYGLFSRAMSSTYSFVAYLGENHGHYTLVYRSISDVSDVSYPVEFFIATLNKDGCIISEQKIASLSSPLHITTATIYPDGHIVSQKVNQIWEKAPEEAGYENNKVIKREITTTDNYHIGSDGKIHG